MHYVWGMEHTTPIPKGRPKKYFFSDLLPGGSQEYRGEEANQNRLTAAAAAFSKKHHKGEWKFSCRTGTSDGKPVVIVTRIA